MASLWPELDMRVNFLTKMFGKQKCSVSAGDKELTFPLLTIFCMSSQGQLHM